MNINLTIENKEQYEQAGFYTARIKKTAAESDTLADLFEKIKSDADHIPNISAYKGGSHIALHVKGHGRVAIITE